MVGQYQYLKEHVNVHDVTTLALEKIKSKPHHGHIIEGGSPFFIKNLLNKIQQDSQ